MSFGLLYCDPLCYDRLQLQFNNVYVYVFLHIYKSIQCSNESPPSVLYAFERELFFKLKTFLKTMELIIYLCSMIRGTKYI